jgi:L-ascorbate metabolism protein UlaG (beta-lactamase superfamily)
MIDPFGDLSAATAGRMSFGYAPIEGADADLVLITHEHIDHNAAGVVDGSPAILRSTAGRLESPLGEVLAVASEHDQVAGTERGPNTMFVFELDGLRIAHFGDLGQRALREEQATAIGAVDLVFLPVGGGPTIGAEQAAAIVDQLRPRWVVPMHYRTPRINFLETADAFLARMPQVQQLPTAAFDVEELSADSGPLAVVPAAP